MTFRQMNLDVFEGTLLPHVFFQPRIEPWYAWHREFNKMPAPYRDMSLLDLFDSLPASMRYVQYYTDMPEPVLQRFASPVTVRDTLTDRRMTHIYQTPYGDLTESFIHSDDHVWRRVKFAVKGPRDLKKLRWLFQHRIVEFSVENFERGAHFMGERGEPQFWVARSPYQALALDWMDYAQFVYALADNLDAVKATLAAIDNTYDQLYEQIIAYGKVKIVNFGENIHGHLITPRHFEELLLPFYVKRAGQLRAAGIFTHIHIDGAVRPLLKYLEHLPFDGIEALTPEPQGDVRLEDIKEHIGNKILLDGIPAVLFMETYSQEELMACVEKIVALFHPRLILGVSDEVPEGAGLEAMERTKLIAQWCLEHK
jgi:hypothetical protein